VAEALAMNDRTRTAWREFVRLDPGNTISWSNLGVSYFVRGDILLDMGRVADAAANFREALALERATKPSLMLWSGLANHAGRLAMAEAMQGHEARVAEALATGQRLRAWSITQLPEGTFERNLRQHIDQFWQCISSQELGADERALAVCQAFTAKVEPLEPPAGASERADWVLWLGFAYASLAESAHALGDLALAERAIERGQALRRSLTGMQLDWESRRFLMQGEAIRAMVLARGGKLAEAQAVIAPALEYQRAVAARPSVSAGQEFDHAVTLYAAALAGVGNRAALLSEASSRMDRLPAELRAARSTVAWRSRIAEEIGRRAPR
jgi:tetratricopeptide (TPR) repeat protein